jgi:hypothetical protein
MMVLSNYGVAQFEVFTNESCFCLHSLLERKKKVCCKVYQTKDSNLQQKHTQKNRQVLH